MTEHNCKYKQSFIVSDEGLNEICDLVIVPVYYKNAIYKKDYVMLGSTLKSILEEVKD